MDLNLLLHRHQVALMLQERSADAEVDILELQDHPESETWICAPRQASRNNRYIVDMELDGTL